MFPAIDEFPGDRPLKTKKQPIASGRTSPQIHSPFRRDANKN
jgi:hypothetical protein